jgi:hypothetical protein
LKKKNDDLDEGEEKVESFLDVRELQGRYDKFKKNEDQMSGALNIKSIRARYADFRKKLEVWKEREGARRRLKKHIASKKTSILEKFNKAQQNMTYEM